jgi:RNA polymerase sigma-70 factor (ECF subfamily)
MDETREDLYRRHADDLVRFATGLVGPFDAPDVVMDAVMRAFLSPGWSGVGNHRAYLYRCVLNRARTHYRAALSRRVRELRAAVPATIEQSLPDLDVLEAVDRLSMRQRAVVVLTYWEDLTVEQVAGTLEISEGSVRRHLARARARLREVLR